MATHKSAIKRNRQNTRKQLINQMRRTRIKSLTKEVLTAVESGNQGAAQDALKKAVPVIQRAASRGTLHQNTASRKISRLSKRVNTIPSGE
ncbi:MAG: 30S ribosomal protein S20 [bacterium]|nr:30S ribosomal protein S20 [bacterium]MDT8396555.1 30S ribosomal protein S20 [bacterium]